MDETMDSIKTILHSKKFQRDAPERLNHLIRRIGEQNLETATTAFSPMGAPDKATRKNRKSNRKQKKVRQENAA